MECVETYLPAAPYLDIVARLTQALASPGCAALVPAILEASGINRPGLAAALLAVELSMFSGEIEPCDVKLTLGEHGDIWPDSIREDTKKKERTCVSSR